MSECLGTLGARDWRENVHSQTVAECSRRDRQRTRALVGRRRWLHHPERLTDSDGDAHVSRKLVCNTRGMEALFLTKERGVYNLHVQVAGGEGNVERAVDVSPNEMEVEVERGRVNP